MAAALVMFMHAPAPAAPRISVTQLWEARFDGLGTWLDQANAMAVSTDGSRVFVTGTSSSTGGGDKGFDEVTVAYDTSTGATLWVSRYDDSHHGYDEGNSIAVGADGSKVFVAGLSDQYVGSHGSDYLTVAMDASTGVGLWARRYDGPAHIFDEAHAVAVSPDGSTVFTTGESRGGTIQPDWATIAYDATTGHHLCVRGWGASTAGGRRMRSPLAPTGQRSSLRASRHRPRTGTGISLLAPTTLRRARQCGSARGTEVPATPTTPSPSR
jgi:hypothetical protein